MKRNATFGKPIPKIVGRRNRQARVIHHEDTRGRWFPVPEDKQDEFLAELHAAGKDRREGKPIDNSRFAKYFTVAKGRTKLYKPRRHANWNEVFQKYKEEDMAARTKAASLKRKQKKSEACKRKKEQLLNKF
ncbi:hypothetical protein A2U01_0041474 [Trifolium medium]|uniref:Uncharacterized protein n=1 Tax=Trifolium medium TaxID=97028 RepID=A0A392Q8T9_9FABA|nr:hypothetical protein [Trifolium medium]